MNLMPFFYETQCHLAGRDSSAKDHDSLLGRWPTMEASIENVLNTGVISWRPLRPLRLFASSHRKHDLLRENLGSRRKCHADAITLDSARTRTGAYMEIRELEALDDPIAVGVEKTKRRPIVGRRKEA